MPPAARAAQFAPFDALTGYGECVQEAARLTEPEQELDEDTRAGLDRQVQKLMQCIGQRPSVTLLCFVPDPYKNGGSYQVVRGRLCRIDLTRKLFFLESGKVIPARAIIRIIPGMSF